MKRLYIYLLGFICFPLFSHAEYYEESDSLYEIATYGQDTAARVEAANQLAKMEFNSPAEKIRYASQAWKESQLIGDPEQSCIAVGQLSYGYMEIEKYEEALNYSEQEQEWAVKLGDKRKLAMALVKTAVCHLHLGEKNKADDQFQNALAVTERLTEENVGFQIRYYYGFHLEKLGFAREALEVQQENLLEIPKADLHVYQVTDLMTFLGNCNNQLEDWPEALVYLEKADSCLASIPDQNRTYYHFAGRVATQKAQAYFGLGKFSAARKEIQRTGSFPKYDLIPDTYEAYLSLSKDLAQQQGNSQKARRLELELKSFQDSVKFDEQMWLAKELEALERNRMRDQKRAELIAEIEKQEQMIEQALDKRKGVFENLGLLIIGGILLIVVAAVIVIVMIRKRSKAK